MCIRKFMVLLMLQVFTAVRTRKSSFVRYRKIVTFSFPIFQLLFLEDFIENLFRYLYFFEKAKTRII